MPFISGSLDFTSIYLLARGNSTVFVCTCWATVITILWCFYYIKMATEWLIKLIQQDVKLVLSGILQILMLFEFSCVLNPWEIFPHICRNSYDPYRLLPACKLSKRQCIILIPLFATHQVSGDDKSMGLCKLKNTWQEWEEGREAREPGKVLWRE